MSTLIKPSALLKKTWVLYREKFVILFGLIFPPCLLLELDPLLNNLDPSFSLNASVLIIIASGFLMTWAGVAAVLALDDKKLTYREACKKSWDRFWSLVWVAIISSFVAGGGLALFIIPGLIFSVYFMFAKIIAILENKKGLSALIHSREYVRGYFWPIAGRYILVVVVSLVIYALLSSVEGFLIGLLNLSLVSEALVNSFVAALINALTFSLVMTAVYLLYQNLHEVKGEVFVHDVSKKALPYLIISALGWVWLFVFTFFLFTMFMTFLISFLTSSIITDAMINASSTLPH